MSSRKQRNRISITVSQDNLIRQVEQLQDELNTANLRNLVLQRDADEASAQAARHLEIIRQLNLSNEHFRLEKIRLEDQLKVAQRIEKGLQQKWDNAWNAYHKTCKELGVLKSVASDVYDLCFEDERDPHVRGLRRVLQVLGVVISRKAVLPAASEVQP